MLFVFYSLCAVVFKCWTCLRLYLAPEKRINRRMGSRRRAHALQPNSVGHRGHRGGNRMRNKCSEKNPSDSLISTVEEQEEGEDKEEEAKRFALRRWKREIEKLRERERDGEGETLERHVRTVWIHDRYWSNAGSFSGYTHVDTPTYIYTRATHWVHRFQIPSFLPSFLPSLLPPFLLCLFACFFPFFHFLSLSLIFFFLLTFFLSFSSFFVKSFAVSSPFLRRFFAVSSPFSKLQATADILLSKADSWGPFKHFGIDSVSRIQCRCVCVFVWFFLFGILRLRRCLLTVQFNGDPTTRDIPTDFGWLLFIGLSVRYGIW